MKASSFLLVATILGFCMTASFGATVTRTGGGGDSSWQTPANWSSHALPGTDDDVVIDVAGNLTVTSRANATIRSLQRSNNLAVGSFVYYYPTTTNAE